MTIKEFEIQYALGSLSKAMKIKLADGASTSKEILTKLSKDKSWYIKHCVAKNPNTPTKVLAKLSEDKDWSTRYWVADNPNTSVKVLTILSKDRDASVRNTSVRNAMAAARRELS